MFSRLKIWARRLSRDGHAIYLASRDPRVPWYVKFLAIAVAGYALSPIDLIPDFIPVVGYLDDLIIVPLGIWLVVSLIPEQVMDEYRAIANEAQPSRNDHHHCALDFWSVDAGLDRLCPLGSTRLDRNRAGAAPGSLFIRHGRWLSPATHIDFRRLPASPRRRRAAVPG